MKKLKKRYYFIIFILLVVIFYLSPIFPFVKSVTVMSVYSLSEKSNSLLDSEEIKLKMPGGLSTLKKDWYPFVMVFNDSYGFSRYIGRDVELTILYNFGAFDYLKGHSTYYDTESDFHNAFYGAYVTKTDERPFGFELDGTPNYEEMALVPEYDMRVLVLESIGCENPQFEWELTDMKPVDSFIGYSDWYVMNAIIRTNSPVHQQVEDFMAYIQYGEPPKDATDNFPLVEMQGRVYAKYFEEHGVSIFFYVIAPDEVAIETCDKEFLQESKLKFK